MSDSGMSTHSIKGEDHYKCREVKAERDRLRAENERLREALLSLYYADLAPRDAAHGARWQAALRQAKAALEDTTHD